MKKTVKDFKVVVVDDNDKVIDISIHKNVYIEDMHMFDFGRLKRQVYDSKSLYPFNYVLYGRDMHVISFMYKHQLYDLQGMKDWAVIKTYIEKDGKNMYLKSKKLLKRCKDIERENLKRMERGEFGKSRV